MNSYLVFNDLTREYKWVDAETPSKAVVKAEAERRGEAEKAFKAGRGDSSDIDVWCGESSILGTRKSVMRGASRDARP
jgi:hypothetical protein